MKRPSKEQDNDMERPSKKVMNTEEQDNDMEVDSLKNRGNEESAPTPRGKNIYHLLKSLGSFD